jgi:uncharacterized protein YidB (DUF937 family)
MGAYIPQRPRLRQSGGQASTVVAKVSILDGSGLPETSLSKVRIVRFTMDRSAEAGDRIVELFRCGCCSRAANEEEHMSRGFPSMTALLGLLAIAGYQNRDKIAEMIGGLGQNPSGAPGLPGQQQGGSGGLGGLGGLLGGLAGQNPGNVLNGGLGELVDRFRQNGQGDIAESWVGTGPNKEVAPPQLEQAIGPDVLATLTQQTGLSREEILARLSRELPQAVDKYTPDGRLPS